MRTLCVLALVSLAGCRSVDTELYARTKREMARFEKGAQKLEGPSTTALPAPWAAGQYAVWAITANDETTLIEALVEDAGPEGATLTMTTLSARLRTTARISFTHQPTDLADARTALSQIIRRRGDDPAFTYTFLPGTPDQMRDALEPLWSTLLPTVVTGESQTVSTAAAKLDGCMPADARFVYKHTALELTGFVHPAVPISGFVKGTAKNGKEVVELMDYGFNGHSPTF